MERVREVRELAMAKVEKEKKCMMDEVMVTVIRCLGK